MTDDSYQSWRYERIREACCDESVIDPDEQARLVEWAVVRAVQLDAAFEMGGYSRIMTPKSLAALG